MMTINALVTSDTVLIRYRKHIYLLKVTGAYYGAIFFLMFRE